MRMNKETAIKTAAEWWANKVCKPKAHSNGDVNSASIFACLLADIGAKDASGEQREVFVNHLESGIREALTNNDRYLDIGCDYQPDTILRDAAAVAGINEMNFPFKTNMSIRKCGGEDYTVSVSDGYGRPFVELAPPL